MGKPAPASVVSYVEEYMQLQNEHKKLKQAHADLLVDFTLQDEFVKEQEAMLAVQQKITTELREQLRELSGGEDDASGVGFKSVDDTTLVSEIAAISNQLHSFAAVTLKQISSYDSEGLVAVLRALSDCLPGVKRSETFDLYTTVHSNSPKLRMVAQIWIRAYLCQLITDEVLNVFMLSSSRNGNQLLTKFHDRLHANKAQQAVVWRRLTFSAAGSVLDNSTIDDIVKNGLHPHLRELILPHKSLEKLLRDMLIAASRISIMIHTPTSQSAPFFVSFCPAVDSPIDSERSELKQRCPIAESNGIERVGGCLSPGLLKVVNGGKGPETIVLRRAAVVCACSLKPPEAR